MFYNIEFHQNLFVMDTKNGVMKKEFSPSDIIWRIQNTNSPMYIRGLLTKIPEGKEAEYKEAILSMVERREHASANIETMRKIAKRGGFLEEFEETHALEKWIPRTNNKYRVFVAKSNDDLQANPDLTMYNAVICDFKGKAEFADLDKLPKRMIVKGGIYWAYHNFDNLPDISESVFHGDFYCGCCHNLTSLEGSPKDVWGDFNCGSCKNLTTLKGAPQKVGGGFDCSGDNRLTTLKGAPQKVDKGFRCCGCNGLTSLEGAPNEVGGNFNCSSCENLTTLKDAPQKVDKNFYCINCPNITSSEGLPEEIGGVIYCKDTPLDKSLGGRGVYIKRDGELYDIFNLPKDKEFVINGDLDLSCMDLKELPDLSNVIVKGDFDCHRNPITSLNGSPKYVSEDFNCYNCYSLTSLEGAPKEVGRNFNCSGCRSLTSLEGPLEKVGRNFDCKNCENLVSAKGLYEKFDGIIDCMKTPLNESLGGIGRYLNKDGKLYDIFNLPKDEEFVINGDLDLSWMYLKKLPDLSNVIVKGIFDCDGNLITSLKGSPKEVGKDFHCSNCLSLKSLEGASNYVSGNFFCKWSENLTSVKELPEHIGGKVICNDKLRPQFEAELIKRKVQAQEQSEEKPQKSSKLNNIFSRLFGKGK